jgi:hypothetical protein
LKFPFVGPSYTLAVRDADIQRTVNMFPSIVESGSGKSPSILRSIPGLVEFADLGSEIRGMAVANDVLYAVGGSGMYSVSNSGAEVLRGSLSTATGVVSMDKNRTQLVAVDGPNGYVLTLSSNAFQPITSPNFYGSNNVYVSDGYAIFVRPNTDAFYISAIDDALAIDALDFEVDSSEAGPITGHIIDHGQIFLFKKNGASVWDNSGANDFPYAKNPGAKIQTGCDAAYSIKQLDNTIYWLGGTENGGGQVWKLSGYTPVRVSTKAIEELLQSSSDLSQAVAYAHQEGGNSFYCLNVPGIQTTLCYEISAGAWHERAEFVAGEFTQHRATCHVFAYGKHLVGTASGKIYELDTSVNNNAGDILCRERTSPYLATPSNKKIDVNGFEFDCDVGTGLSSGAAAQVMVRYSKNGGKTWAAWRYVSLGVVGQWRTRAKILRLGNARDWVFQVRCTDDVPFNIVSAEVT